MWWSRGHGSLIDTPNGDWWIVYHAYENSFTSLGRQTLLEPVEFTADGWFRSKGTDVARPVPVPDVKPTPEVSRFTHLGEFRIGYEWKFYKNYEPQRISVSNGVLTMQGKG